MVSQTLHPRRVGSYIGFMGIHIIWQTGSTKTQLIGAIRERCDYLSCLIDNLSSAALPDKQCAIVRLSKGKKSFYIMEKGKEIYLNSKRIVKLPVYAQNRYRTNVLAAAKRELSQLERCLRILETGRGGPSDVSIVYDLLPEELKPYVDPMPLSDAVYALKWQNDNRAVKKRRRNQKDKYHIYETQRGEYVTSKSEALIANILKDRGVPYHYEVAFTPETKLDYSRPVYDEDYLGNMEIVGYETMDGFTPYDENTLHPDFLVLNKRTRKEYFWEHMGRVDDEGYCKENLNRLIRYVDAGFRIGEDVIITSETRERPLDTRKVNEMIDRFLV